MNTSGVDPCVCQAGPGLTLCSCSIESSWVMRRQVMSDPMGTSCAFLSAESNNITVRPCGKSPQMWYFESGNCFLGMEMVDTAMKTWNFTVATTDELLELKEVEYEMITNHTAELVQFYLNKDVCIDVDWNCSVVASGAPFLLENFTTHQCHNNEG